MWLCVQDVTDVKLKTPHHPIKPHQPDFQREMNAFFFLESRDCEL